MKVMDDAALRDELRPHGIPSARCPGCVHFGVCGGVEPDRPLIDDCFSLSCCGKSNCDNVCPYGSGFVRWMYEVGGIRFDDLAPVTQGQLSLPRYIPLIHHGYSHRHRLEWPVVALDTYQVFRLREKVYRSIADDDDQ